MQTSDTIQAGMILGCGVVTAGAGAALLVGGQRTPRPALEGVLGVALSGTGLAVVGAWVLLFLVAVLAELLRRHGPSPLAAFASACTPAMMRRLAAALLGVHLLAVPAVGQAATGGIEGAAGQVLAATTAAQPAPAARPGSPDPTEPVSPAWKPEPLPAGSGPMLRGESRTVVDAEEAVVAPGDSLWSIVAARLGPLASDADIAEVWPAWYHTNRAVIGDDPSFLLPGTVLQAPPG